MMLMITTYYKNIFKNCKEIYKNIEYFNIYII